MVMEKTRRPGLSWQRLGLRVAGAGLLAVTGAIHLDLYLTGYRSIPTIGAAGRRWPGRLALRGGGKGEHSQRARLQEGLPGAGAATAAADTAPGQAHGNNLNLNGGLWHEVTVSG
jgi:hypothetical protein